MEDEIKKFTSEDETVIRTIEGDPRTTDLEPADCNIRFPQQVSLIANGAPTDRYKMMLQTLPSGQEYGIYLSEKYYLADGWEAIDWQAFKTARLRSSNDGPALTKMLNGWLATAETVCKRGPHELQMCPFCGQPETTSHLFQCHKAERAATITQQLASFWNNITSTLPATLHSAIKDATDKWITDNPDDTIQGHKPIIAAQAMIGWGQFFRGWITSSIQAYLSSYLQTNGHWNHAKAAKEKCFSLIHEIWNLTLKLWQSCNQRASDTSRPEPTIQRSKWQSTVRYFYTPQHYFPVDDRQALFATPVDRLCSATEATLASWCIRFQSVYQACKQKTAKFITETHRPILD